MYYVMSMIVRVLYLTNFQNLPVVLFLSWVGVNDTLEFEEEEDNGGFVNPVGGGGWATDEFIAVCAGILEGSFASKYEK